MRYALNDDSQDTVEFRLIEDAEMPPIIIKQHEHELTVVVMINLHHKIWLSLKRKSIAGANKNLFGEIDKILNGYLEEQLKMKEFDEQ
tara:strand:- start:12552 stop:12815 length:264 start_codon:yes stop_codon:yes gene_type:complete